MNTLELWIVFVCYSVASARDLLGGNKAMAWVWFTYAIGLFGFMALRK